MLIINNINLPLDTDFDNLKPVISKILKLKSDDINSVSLYKKSVDARKKSEIHFCCSVLLSAKSESAVLKKCKTAQTFINKKYEWKTCENSFKTPPVIAGFGPAGMFAALTLARAGLCPTVIERGSSVDIRTAKVNDFFGGGSLNTECNVQFGEGGAGTFSDGKLNTGIKDSRCRTVLEVLHSHGAPDSILTDAKPHIGTDILKKVVKNIREEILHLGGRVLFDTKLERVNIKNGKLVSVLANGGEIPCDKLIIAIGHSARDTFKMLCDAGLFMAQKPFAVGVRIEHLQKDINRALYGKFSESKYLGAADYKLAAHLKNGRGVYTFCMCPGGYVINASSEHGAIAINGMSESLRNAKNSNSALLVGINTDDFEGSHPLAGCDLQKSIESAAFNIAGGRVPVTTVGSFVRGEKFEITKVKPTVKPEFAYADFGNIFPSFVCESLKEGISVFGKKILGFDDGGAVLTAPETRSSSPVRILRNENLQSVNIGGIYPCGEGAGYAGGIVSAAVDGIKVAEEIISGGITHE